MRRKRTDRFWRAAAHCLLGSIAIAGLTFLAFRLEASAAEAGLLYFFLIVLFSLWARFVPSLLVSILAILCFDYFFTPPLFTFDLRETGTLDIVALLVFSGTAFVITRLMSRIADRTAALEQSNEQLRSEIGERKRAENVLREQASLLDLTHDTIFVRDMNDVITYWNRGAEELYGWKREEALGKVTHQLLQTIFPAPLDEIVSQLLQTDRWSGDLIHTKRDGTTAVVASRWSVQRDGQGKAIGTLETNNDITESKRAEEALARQANLLEQTHDAIFVWEFPGTITYWNRGAEQIYGISEPDAVGRPSHELLKTVHPLPIPLFEAALERDGQWTGELTQTTRDGRQIVVESRQVLMRQADGRRLVLETNRDITERKLAETEQKHAEEALRNVQMELAHVNRVATLGELAASIAHEVNQPLSGVVINGNACLRWLAGGSPNLDEAREAASRIVRDGKRAGDVVARIRALATKSSTVKERLNMNEAIQEVVGLARDEVRRNGVKLRTELAGGLSPVLGDRVQLQQVLLNLVMNGVEAMNTVEEGPRDLVIETQDDEADQVRVTVQDSGVGLDPESMERIFDAFYTTKDQGMGMGLSISRSIIQNHGGRLWAAANDGPGTNFQFTVPKYQ
jgi:PAS domain S-box-containing protein